MSVTISYPSTQFEELYEPFVNLGVHLPPKDNSPKIKTHENENLVSPNFRFSKNPKIPKIPTTKISIRKLERKKKPLKYF